MRTGGICAWIGKSYQVTASTETKQSTRPLKEWLIPSNPKYFDIIHAFDEKKEIIWKQESGIKLCPRCGKPLILRTAKKGDHAGEQFYGCSGFPGCRYTEKA